MAELSKDILFNSVNQLSLGIIIIDQDYDVIFYNQWIKDCSTVVNDQKIGCHISEILEGFNDSRLSEACYDALILGLPSKLSNTFNPKPLPLFQKGHIGDINFRLHQQISVKNIQTQSKESLCEILINDVSSSVKKELMLKKLADENKKQQLKAEQANLSKSQFLANMSHEIRTPMNGVLGMLNLLSTTEQNQEQRHFTKLAQSSADTLLNIINDILDFSKIEAGKLEIELIDFDLISYLGDLVQSLSMKSKEKKLETILDVTDVEHQMVIGDPGRIRQIITNLVGNAVKFTQEGEIVVKASTKSNDEGSITLNIDVVDTGIGIPEDKCSMLFEAFSQVDVSTTREFGGTGLGLSIVKELCLLMGGEIIVSSVLGQGSKFSFNIQLNSSNANQLKKPNVDLQGINVLIVDDNHTNLEVLNKQLSMLNVKVKKAASGSEALALLAQCGKGYFAMAIIDMQMPEMSGDMLCQEIKKDSLFKDLKLIMLTSMDRRGDVQHFSKLGFSAYLLKPVIIDELTKAMAIILDNKQALKSASPIVSSHYISSLEKLNTDDNIRILLVEDNRINQQVALGILRKFGYSVDIAVNGLEAIKILEDGKLDKCYQMILMDCQMPEMDGYQTTEYIRNISGGNINSNIPIIAMTANTMKGDKEKCLNSGMNDYIAKPINPKLLQEKLNHWLGSNE